MGKTNLMLKMNDRSRMKGDLHVRMCVQQRWTYPVGVKSHQSKSQKLCS